MEAHTINSSTQDWIPELEASLVPMALEDAQKSLYVLPTMKMPSLVSVHEQMQWCKSIHHPTKTLLSYGRIIFIVTYICTYVYIAGIYAYIYACTCMYYNIWYFNYLMNQ